MRRPGRTALLSVGAATALATVAGGMLSFTSSTEQDHFPHERHAGLFPTCVGCHAGIAAGDTVSFVSIAPEDCAGCHDGVQIRRVEWEGRERPPSNLAFPHPTHVAVLQMDCALCHNAPDAPVRMAVQRAAVPVCLGCHAPQAEGHLDLAAIDCTTCHVPLVQAADLSSDRIAGFPRPPSHDLPDFLLTHGETAEAQGEDCTVCHARASCERCHLNAADVPAIAALASDARVAALVAGRAGEWPEPPSHQREDWAWTHEDAARESIETCANCHTRSSCAECHGQGRPAIAARLPEVREGGPTGVQIAVAFPAGHSETFFDRHGTAAAIGVPDCAGCHAEKECLDCHDGVDRPGFHPLDFVVRHGAEAFSERTECAACHSREAFCRDCHSSLGFAARRQLGSGAAFHDAQPDWLLAHGQAARQDLESCVGCHEERSCLRCHSARSGFRISPHGPDFDPAHVADKSTQSCAICHFGLPEGIEP